MKGASVFRELRGLGTLQKLSLILLLAFVLAAGCGSSDSGGGGSNSGGSTSGGGGTSGETTSSGGGDSVPDQVTVASDIAYPPFESNIDGEPAGFDIDLMREIADRVGFEADFQDVRFDRIVQGLASGQYEIAISAMTITPERQEQVAFSEPYYNSNQSLLVQQDSGIESTDDLGEAIVGVQSRTTGALEAQELEENNGVGSIRTFNTIADAFNALENGQIDAVIYDFPVSRDRVEQSEGLEIVENLPTGEQYGVAFPEDSDLVQPVNEALTEIKEDGTYAELYKKWFGQEPEEIP